MLFVFGHVYAPHYLTKHVKAVFNVGRKKTLYFVEGANRMTVETLTGIHNPYSLSIVQIQLHYLTLCTLKVVSSRTGEGEMGDRTTTNILLAVIAAVLLFGSAAVTGAIQWIAIIGGCLLALYAVVAFALYLLGEAAKALVEAKKGGAVLLVQTIFGLVAMSFLPIFGGYVLLLWMQGVPKPARVVADTWVGMTWLGILIAGGVAMAVTFLYARRHEIIPALRYGLSLLIRSPLAPYFLTVHGWRKARAEGDNVYYSTASAFMGFIFGIFVWILGFGLLAAVFLDK